MACPYWGWSIGANSRIQFRPGCTSPSTPAFVSPVPPFVLTFLAKVSAGCLLRVVLSRKGEDAAQAERGRR
eukprot:2841203-Rhodomonas_salina.5